MTTSVDEVSANGETSLREAITAAGAGDAISFDAAFPAGSYTGFVLTLGALPNVAAGVTITSSGQVAIDGTSVSSGHGLVLSGNNTVTGLEIRGFPGNGMLVGGSGGGSTTIGSSATWGPNYVHGNGKSGLRVFDTVGNGLSIVGNGIGLTPTLAASGNCAGAGTSACAGIRIDAGTVGAANIEDNTIVATTGVPSYSQGIGLLVSAGSGHQILDNFIGTLATSGTAMDNAGAGIDVMGPDLTGVVIEGNVVSHNGGGGVRLGPGSSQAIVQSNFIGTDETGSTDAGNGDSGIRIFASDGHQILDNVISGNDGHGIELGGANAGDWHSDGIIRGNRIGTDTTGAWAIPNDGSGIESVGEEGGYQIGGPAPGQGNLVSGNALHGMSLHDPDHVVRGNRVGTSADGMAAIPNGTATAPIFGTAVWSGIEVGGSGIVVGSVAGSLPALPDLEESNQVSGNTDRGITVVDGSDVVVRYNLVGSDADGNGASGMGQGQAGILVRGGHDVLVAHNIVVGNGAAEPFGDGEHGIWIHDDVSPIDQLTVSYNQVGLGLDDLPAGNMGDGIRFEGRDHGIQFVAVAHNGSHANGGAGMTLVGLSEAAVYGNVLGDGPSGHGNDAQGLQLVASRALHVHTNAIAGNGSSGVLLRSSLDNAMSDITLENNQIGPSDPAWPGNDSSGIKIIQDDAASYHLPISDCLIEGNTVFDNGQYGIHGLGPFAQVTWRDNLLYDNELCGIELVDGANGSVEAPEVDEVTASTLSGTFSDSYLGRVDTVQVFADDGAAGTGEARYYLGNATVVDDTWSFSASGHSLFEVRAVLILTDGSASELTKTCGDRCDGHAIGMCADGETCTWEYCDELLGCQTGPRPEGFRCDDNDALTGVVNATVDDPDQCDGAGTCVGGGTLTPAECPFANPCVVTTANAGEGCKYHRICDGPVIDMDGDGFTEEACTPHDLDGDPATGGRACEDTCNECAILPDDDGDGLPNFWEENGGSLDMNCDGVQDAFHVLPVPGVPDVYLELDYMSVDCDDDLAHNHRLDQTLIDELIDAFAEQGIALHVDHSEDGCIPEVPVVAMRPGTIKKLAPRDPDCQEWALFDDLKAKHFTPHRNGYYHYGVMAHTRSSKPDGVNKGYGDGLDQRCKPGGGDSSVAERYGDSFLITKNKSVAYTATASDPPDAPDWLWGGVVRSVVERSSVMHELGHNLGLEHGGSLLDPGLSTPTMNKKPNVQSSMNYGYLYNLYTSYEAAYGGADYGVDYSQEAMPDLDEQALDESAGLMGSGLTDYLVRWRCGNGNGVRFGRADGNPLNWDCDDTIGESGVQHDLNRNGWPFDLLQGAREWDKLYYTFQCAPDGDGLEDAVDLSLVDAEALGLVHGPYEVEMDVEPFCASDPIATDGTGSVRVVVHGDGRWDPEEVVLATVEFQFGRPQKVAIADVDQDGYDDLALVFASADLDVTPQGNFVAFYGQLDTTRPLFANGSFTPVATFTDVDADGVIDDCDQCPASAPGAAVDYVGCP